jgi:hypothetical protein
MEPRLVMSTSFLPEIVSTIKLGTRSDGQRAVRLLKAIQSDNPEQSHRAICGPVLELAVKGDGPEVLDFLLQLGIDHTHITPTVIEKAASNGRHEKVLMEMLFANHAGHTVVSEEVMVAACRNFHAGTGLLELLLETSRQPISVTEDIMVTACKNDYHGCDLVAAFIKQFDTIPSRTHNAISCPTIIQNWNSDRVRPRIAVGVISETKV